MNGCFVPFSDFLALAKGKPEILCLTLRQENQTRLKMYQTCCLLNMHWYTSISTSLHCFCIYIYIYASYFMQFGTGIRFTSLPHVLNAVFTLQLQWSSFFGAVTLLPFVALSNRKQTAFYLKSIRSSSIRFFGLILKQVYTGVHNYTVKRLLQSNEHLSQERETLPSLTRQLGSTGCVVFSLLGWHIHWFPSSLSICILLQKRCPNVHQSLRREVAEVRRVSRTR